MTDEPSYYAVIPACVRYCEELSANAKLLYGEITALANKGGYCWASNTYFAELYNVSKFTISDWISKLQKNGFIKTEQGANGRRIYVSEPINRNTNTPLVEIPNPPCGNPQPTIVEIPNHNNTINNTKNNTILAEPEQKTQSSNIVNFREAAKPKQKTLAQLVEEYSQDINIKTELNKYLAMRKEKKDYPTITQFAAMLENLKTLGAVSIQIKSIQQSLRSGYRDFFPLGKSSYTSNSFDTAAGHTQEKSYKNMTPKEREEYELNELARNADGSEMKF